MCGTSHSNRTCFTPGPLSCDIMAPAATCDAAATSKICWIKLQQNGTCDALRTVCWESEKAWPKEPEGLMGVVSTVWHLRKRWFNKPVFVQINALTGIKQKLIMCIWLQIQFQSSLHECCENQASMCWVLTHVAIMLLGKICVLLVSPFSHLKQER